MIGNDFLRKVTVKEYKPWDSDTAVTLFLPESNLEVHALGYGDPKNWARDCPIDSAQWVHLSVHWNSFSVLSDEQEKSLDGFNAIGFCKALTTDRDGSPLVILESIIDVVLDDEVMGDQIRTVEIGDWYKVTNHFNPLLIVDCISPSDFGESKL